MAMVFDKQRFEESYGILAKAANQQVIEHMNELASVLKPHAGENEDVDNLLAQCKKTQDFYNDQYKHVLDDTLKNFSELTEIAEYLAAGKAVDEIASGSIDYQKSGIDASSVM